jgi:hypothetical protein
VKRLLFLLVAIRGVSHFVPRLDFISPKKRQSPMEIKPWGIINNIIL